MIRMTKKEIPELIRLFINLLWVHSPKNWILKSTYFQNTLFVSMLILMSNKIDYNRIRRNFTFDVVKSREFDLSGLASDCIDEMKKELC